MVNLQSSLRYLVGQAIDAAQRGDGRQLREYLTQYSEIVGEFLDQTNPDQSAKIDESAARSIVKDFRRDFQTILTHTLATTNRDCVRELLNTEGAILRRGVEEKNVLLVEEFSQVYVQNYRQIVRSGEADDYIEDELLRSFSRPVNRIEKALAEASTSAEVERGKDIVNSLFSAYRELYWEAIASQRTHLFGLCWAGFETSIGPYRPASRPVRGDDRSGVNGDDDQTVSERAEDLITYFRNSIDLYRFAATAWAFRVYQENDVSDAFFESLLTDFVIPKYRDNPDKIASIYFDIGLDDDRQFDDWRRREVPPTKQSFSFGSASQGWLLDFYAFIGPLLLAEAGTLSDDEIDFSVPAKPTVRGRIESVEKRIDEYREEGLYDQFAQSFDSLTQEQVDTFLETHRDAVEESAQLEFDAIRQADADEEKQQEYKRESLNRFNDEFLLRSILKSWDNLMREEDSADLRTVSYLDPVPKSQFTDVQSFHMSSRPNVRPIIGRILSDFADESQFESRSLRDFASLPDQIADAVQDLDVSETGLVIVVPELRLGTYLDHDRFQHPADVDNPPITGTIYVDGVPVKMDQSVRGAGCAALIVQDITELQWQEYTVQGSPLGIEVTEDESRIRDRLETHGIDSDIDLNTGRPYVAVEYEYQYRTIPETYSGITLSLPEN
jgi:hypothetical protein